jgi:hypothetical protein
MRAGSRRFAPRSTGGERCLCSLRRSRPAYSARGSTHGSRPRARCLSLAPF